MRRGLHVLGVAAVCALGLNTANADGTVALGGTAGVTLGPSSYFPTLLIGASGELYRSVFIGNLSLGISARLQLYAHREDEDFGSWGGQQDLSFGVRVALFSRDSPRRVNPFVLLRFGGAVVERVPFRSSASAELLGGYLWGGTLGVDIRTSRLDRVTRIELAFDKPSFTTRDDSNGPVGELSIAVMAGLTL